MTQKSGAVCFDTTNSAWSVQGWTSVILDSGRASREPIEMRSQDELPEEYIQWLQRFPGREHVPVSIERYGDGNYVASLQEDGTVFSEGESMDDALANLIASARDDYDILRAYGDNIDATLAAKRQLLEALFA